MKTLSAIQRKSSVSAFSENTNTGRALPVNDQRPETLVQRRLQESAQAGLQSGKAVQLQQMADRYSENHTGLPAQLKNGVEALSGYAMDDVKVHYNSAQPAGIGAHAYTQGTNIHVAPGQERHLPHEAWHVVQQKRGEVKPTMQLKSVRINDDPGLETEADTMGEKALQPVIQQKALLKNSIISTSAPVQRKPIYVKKGAAVDKKWTFIKTDGVYDYYDDGEADYSQVAKLKPTRDVVNSMDMDTLSDIDESDTELDAKTKGPHKVYRVNNVRDSAKLVHKVLKPNPTSTFGVRVNGGNVFRLTGKDTQVSVQTTSQNALMQDDDTQRSGYMPPRLSTDPGATGNVNSYEHVVSELRNHTAPVIAQAMYNRFVSGIPFPAAFSLRAQAKMDELYVLLTVAETYRSPYAFAIYTAAIQAMINGATTAQEAFYAGVGQIKALHVGASSNSGSGISGQLMEQNMGMGVNNPHPTQPGMNITETQWKSGLARTETLFDKASTGTDYTSMLTTHMVTPMGFGGGGSSVVDITSKVTTTRSPGSWKADLVVAVSGIVLKEGDKVKYKGTDYSVKSVGTQWVLLLNA